MGIMAPPSSIVPESIIDAIKHKERNHSGIVTRRISITTTSSKRTPIVPARAAGEEYDLNIIHQSPRRSSIGIHWTEVWRIASENMFPFLVMIDKWKWNNSEVAEYQGAMKQLQKEVQSFLQQYNKSIEFTHEQPLDEAEQRTLAQLDSVNEILVNARNISHDRTHWADLLDHLIPHYVELSQLLNKKQSKPLSTLRYGNSRRSVFHVCNALTIVILFHFVLTPASAPIVATTAACLCWTGEMLKHHIPAFKSLMISTLGAFAREHELTSINSATWYTTALVVLSVGFPEGPYAMLGVVMLGIGDPTAAFVGKKVGRHRLSNGKSWEGFAAFIASSVVASMVYLVLFSRSVNFQNLNSWLWITSAACAGALAEVYSGDWDDNFTIPVTVACTTYLLDRYSESHLFTL